MVHNDDTSMRVMRLKRNFQGHISQRKVDGGIEAKTRTTGWIEAQDISRSLSWST